MRAIYLTENYPYIRKNCVEKNKKTILFLEDEEELLATVENLLNDQGYNVVTVKRAEEALELVRKSPPDLILADIKLPGMDGFDFFTEVQKLPEVSKTPFVYLTAFNDMNAMLYAKRQGAAEYITKPFDFEYLLLRIKDLLTP